MNLCIAIHSLVVLLVNAINTPCELANHKEILTSYLSKAVRTCRNSLAAVFNYYTHTNTYTQFIYFVDDRSLTSMFYLWRNRLVAAMHWCIWSLLLVKV